MKRCRLLTAVAVLMVFATVMTFAQDQDRGGQRQFDPAAWLARFDVNADGKVTRDEFRGNDQVFARLDNNGDGAITPDELGAMQARRDRANAGAGGEGGRRFTDPAWRWQMMLQRFDQDGDGKLTRAEFQGAPRVFMRLDQDGDGVLTEEEASRIRGGDDEPAAERRGFSFEALLQNADKDGDGKISAAEWPGRPEMFQRLDADGDGLFTAEEEQRRERPRVGQRGDRVDPAQIFIRMLDKSGDGQVSNSEWTDWFGGADENADGLLSHAELTKKLQETMRPQPQPAVEE